MRGGIEHHSVSVEETYVSRLVSGGEGTEQEGEGLTLVEQKRQYQSPFGMVVSLGCGGRETR